MTGPSRSWRTGLSVVSVTLTLSAAFAPPASATRSSYNCTMTTQLLDRIGGDALAHVHTEVRCSANREVQVEMEIWGEDYTSADDRLGRRTTSPLRIHYHVGYFNLGPLSCNEDHGEDEYYGRARMRVRSVGGSWHSWTSWETSSVRRAHCGPY